MRQANDALKQQVLLCKIILFVVVKIPMLFCTASWSTREEPEAGNSTSQCAEKSDKLTGGRVDYCLCLAFNSARLRSLKIRLLTDLSAMPRACICTELYKKTALIFLSILQYFCIFQFRYADTSVCDYLHAF